MGISRSPAELERKLGALSVVMADLPLAQVKEASLIVKTSIKTIAPDRLRGVGKRGARLNVRYNIGDFGGEAKSLVFATGPWQLIERNTRPHRIPRSSSRGRQRYAVIPGVGVRAYANHPGTHGQHPWRRGVEAAKPAVQRIFRSQADFALRRIF